MIARYAEHDRHRHREPATDVAADLRGRSPFAVDRDRIAAAAAFDRLAGVTQIDGPRLGRWPHHRRAHSLAVAHLGQAMASRLGVDQDLVEAGCLSHDLGHPPFGHDGERALAVVTEGHGGFEANAQTLRILTRLAPLVPDGDPADGLHLTRATLDATCKYPWPSAGGNAEGHARKFGAYPDDMATLMWLREGAPPRRRCLEAQIMDWADDVANAVHDLAHGIRTRRIPASALLNHTDRAALARLAATDVTALPPDLLQVAADDLAALPAMRHLGDRADASATQLDASLATLAAQLRHRYVSAAVHATLAHHTADTMARHRADLHLADWARAEVAVLTALTLHHLLRTAAHRRRRAHRMNLIAELCDHLARNTPSPSRHSTWRAASDDTAHLRAVVDTVAALTDAQAVQAGLRIRARPPA